MAGLRRSAVLAAAMWAMAACSSDEGAGSLKALGVDDGASKGVSTSQQVTGEKDVRLTLSTGALLQVPQGAVEKSVQIGMERPADTKALDLVGRFKTDQDRIVSAPYVLTPHGTKFKEDVTVTLPLAKSGTREVSVAWLEDENDKEWKKLGVARSNGKKAEITLKHFSVLVVIEDASDLPEVEDIGNDQPDASAFIDAGADEGPDAGGADGADAGVAPVRDAGSSIDIDAGAASDAGDGLPDTSVRDGGSSGQSDGGTRVDASGPVLPDGGTTAPDAGVYMEQYDQLMACSLVTLEGNFSAAGMHTHPNESPYSLCIHRCFGKASCMDAQTYRCNLDRAFSFEVSTCVSDCSQSQNPVAYCAEAPQTQVLRCDAVADCLDASDEVGCDPSLYFDCGVGEPIAQGLRCDGFADCGNGADEAGCFACDSGRVVAPWQVCDGVADCNDVTDEGNCAEIECAIITQ